jgi:hypothetical protein
MKKNLLVGLLLCGLIAPVLAGEWTVIFDGKPTNKLRGYKQKGFPTNSWVIEDGALKTVPGKSVDVITVDKYGDVDLEFEWKVEPGANSGVMYRVAETSGPAYSTGPELQILDDAKHADGKNPKTSAGALYALIAPNDQKKLKPVGEFNSAKLVIKGDHVEHWLNGAKVVEYTWGSPEIKALIKQSKFNDMPDFMSQKTGHIAFQHHGDTVWFRNIRVRKI